MTTDNMNAAQAEPDALLFSDVVFTIISPLAQQADYADEALALLEDNGATYRPVDQETGRVQDVRELTHIISTTVDFPDYQPAMDASIPTVKPSWVVNSLARKKLCNPRQESSDPRMFMSGVTVHCADLPESDKEAIAGGMLAFGGNASGPMTKMVTHIVALTVDNTACEIARLKNLHCKVVLPHWFDDCVKLGKRVPEAHYELPEAEILHRADRPKPVHHHNRDIAGALSPTPSDPPSSSADATGRALDVFSGRVVKLSDDLALGSHLTETLEGLIRSGGGWLTGAVHEADMFVCQFRDGDDYVQASQAGKDVGNLAWLYHLIAHNAWTSPLRRMLHYPVPRHGIEGFPGLRISISNFQGDSRIYLESLVKATGAQFTKTMKQDNTHLIAAHTKGEKWQAAKEWNIHLTNHLWLEDSYAQCRMQSLSDPRYSYFPPGTNLGDIVGHTSIDHDAVARIYFPAKPKRVKGQQLTPAPSSAVIPTSSMVAPPATKTGDNVKEEDAAAQPAQTPKTAKARRVKSEAALRTPAASRDDPGKENEMPPSTGRAAKMKATSKLHNLATDIALYQKETKRVGGVVYGGRKVSDPDRVDKSKRDSGASDSRKRSVDAESSDVEEEPESTPAHKKAKGNNSELPPVIHRLMVSGDDRWVKNPSWHTRETKKLRELGIELTEDPTEVTILCAPKAVRTRKFVAAIAAAPRVVSTEWLSHCLKHHAIPKESEFRLVDREAEKRFSFTLADALTRARHHRRRLLKCWRIFCTDHVNGGFDTFADIVQANGGTCAMYKGRAGVTALRRGVDSDGDSPMTDTDEEDEDDIGGQRERYLYLISGQSGPEKNLWPKFRHMAEEEKRIPRIVKPDWLLHIAMAQRIEWKDEFALS